MKVRNPLRINSSRIYLDRFVAAAAKSVAPGSLVLDAGAGEGPYRKHFAAHRYESTDFEKLPKPYQTTTYVCDLADVPVEDDRFDLVVLTQVLEHLPEPLAALKEMHRVLKPGHKIWASTPLFYEEHEQPYDFFRYTQFALQRLFTDAGFSDVMIRWLEGYWGTVSYELQVAGRAVGLPFRPLLNTAGAAWALADLRRKRTDIGHPKNYTIVATA
jgi:ubiquinone/menaquinone biosynthesis C-methylase UbiE